MRTFTVYATHHGPIVSQRDGKWVAIALMQKPIEALQQSFLLTKARDYAGYMKVMELRANSSNNTIFADADGDIAYLHPQFVPRRDDRFDYTHPVDGAESGHRLEGSAHARANCRRCSIRPNGWIMNTNDWPYSAAGDQQPTARELPALHGHGRRESARRPCHAAAARIDQDFTPASLNAAAFDSYLPAFAQLMPSLVAAYDGLDGDGAAEGQTRRSDRGAAAVGRSLGRALGGHDAGRALGR